MNKPVLVWKRNDLRIIAVDADPDDEDDFPVLILERKFQDLMGEEGWDVVHLCDDSGASDAVLDLVQAIASEIEVLPKWVRDFVRARQEPFEGITGKGGKGEAS